MRDAGLSGRTVTTKVRLYDFTTLSRSTTMTDPTDDVRVLAPAARRLLADVDTSGGVRLLGVGVSGLADWVQDDLFVDAADALAEQERVSRERASAPAVGLGSDAGPGVARRRSDLGGRRRLKPG